MRRQLLTIRILWNCSCQHGGQDIAMITTGPTIFDAAASGDLEKGEVAPQRSS